MSETIPAAELPVALFRQIYHWPLISKSDEKFEPGAPWRKVEDPFTPLLSAENEAEVEIQRTWAVQEFNYFHDAIQRFLYAKDASSDSGFTLYQRADLTTMEVAVGPVESRRTHRFNIDRLSLHVFNVEPQVAMVTLELAWDCAVDGKPLMLADMQTLIDHTRRSYAPFWIGKIPARCPAAVTLTDAAGVSCRYDLEAENPPSKAFEAIARDRENDAPIFPHWRDITGLKLNDGTESCTCEWRDPSDERIPTMSFIALEPETGRSARDTMRRIDRSDWLRITDAEEAGKGWPYNQEFLKDTEKSAYYDRFYPDDYQDKDVATRHIFGGAHYALVTINRGVFPEILQNQFRRHYAQMGLLARFEKVMLLGFSSAIAEAAGNLGREGNQAAERKFTDCIVDLHRQFLLFVNRFRFTGVSSQIQGIEMFDRWRDSLGLDTLYNDVKTELEATSAYLQTRAETRRADASEKLNLLAFVIALIALVTGIAATPAWDRWVQDGLACAPSCTWAETGVSKEIGRIFSLCLLGGLCWWIWRKFSCLRCALTARAKRFLCR